MSGLDECIYTTPASSQTAFSVDSLIRMMDELGPQKPMYDRILMRTRMFRRLCEVFPPRNGGVMASMLGLPVEHHETSEQVDRAAKDYVKQGKRVMVIGARQ